MKKAIFIILIASLSIIPLSAQKKQQETVIKREVTLYNPYRPSLNDVLKKSFLPDLTDTATIKPVFRYDIQSRPFMPSYSISSIKPASLVPDPLPKLYKSYIKLGIGDYLAPLGEVSITNERSKTGAIGLNLRHFSTNGKVKLQNDRKVFAGYMDNDASLYGKKFFQSSILQGSVDFSQKVRYAYGYDTIFRNYYPEKKDIKLNYINAGANIGLASSVNDSSQLQYDFNLKYNFFTSASDLYLHNIGIHGIAAKNYAGFYMGSAIDIDHYLFSDSLRTDPRFVFSISPFVKKKTSDWAIKLGLQFLVDRRVEGPAKLHLYPDVDFRFNIIPSYVSFFADLSGKMEQNSPSNVILQNPFLKSERGLYNIPNTDYALIFRGGLTGSTGIGGSYQLSASYSIVNDFLMFSNEIADIYYFPYDTLRKGNYFKPLSDNAEVLNIHGEFNGKINENFSFTATGNYYRYTLDKNELAWNMPDWDARLGVKYNLVNKIFAGVELEALGSRIELLSAETMFSGTPVYSKRMLKMPAHFNINLNAEYKYTRILSFWVKLNNISFDKYYEWANYPSMRFIGLIGFTYSL
jgi:hypothetical protein